MSCPLLAYRATAGGRTYVQPMWLLIGWPWLYGPYKSI